MRTAAEHSSKKELRELKGVLDQINEEVFAISNVGQDSFRSSHRDSPNARSGTSRPTNELTDSNDTLHQLEKHQQGTPSALSRSLSPSEPGTPWHPQPVPRYAQLDDFADRPNVHAPSIYVRQGVMTPLYAKPPPGAGGVPPGRVFDPETYPLGADWAARVARPKDPAQYEREIISAEGERLRTVTANVRGVPPNDGGITTPRLQNKDEMIPYGAVILPVTKPAVVKA